MWVGGDRLGLDHWVSGAEACSVETPVRLFGMCERSCGDRSSLGAWVWKLFRGGERERQEDTVNLGGSENAGSAAPEGQERKRVSGLAEGRAIKCVSHSRDVLREFRGGLGARRGHLVIGVLWVRSFT